MLKWFQPDRTGLEFTYSIASSEHLQMITKTRRIVARLRFQQLLCGISTGFEPRLSWELGGSDHSGSHLASPQGIPEKSSWVTWGTNYGEIW